MKAYYEHAGITIFHAHYVDILASLPLVDLVLTDPPYGETSLEWDDAEIAWLSGMDRIVARPGSVWSFGSLRYLTWLLCSKGMSAWRHAQEIVWEKHNGSNFHTDRFRRVHEIAVHLYRRDTPWGEIYKCPITTNDATARAVRRKRRPPHMGQIESSLYRSEDGGPRLMTSVVYERSCHGTSQHPTQKPLGIIKMMMEYSCPPSGLVLDLFSGSGSTLVAARDTGRRAIGIEIEERYCEIAAKRLAQEVLPLCEGVYQ